MASQPSPPLSSHYASQSGLAVAFARILQRLWPNVDRVELYALLTQFAQASASLAADDYAARRVDASLGRGFTVPHAPGPSPEQFSNTLNYVYEGVENDPEAALQRLEASFTRLALQSGRVTVVQAVQADPQARAWARETRADCCYFCALMATRGAVYRDEGAAGKDANAKFTGSGSFKFHNNCHCVAVPVFGEFEKTAEARAWTRQYHDLRRDHGSVSLSMWRDHFESATQNVPQLAGT